MKYSLRSLFVVVTLVAVVLGSRIEYLRRWAVFHETEAKRYRQITEHRSSRKTVHGFFHHAALASRYHYAVTHPWTTVNESPALMIVVLVLPPLLAAGWFGYRWLHPPVSSAPARNPPKP